MLHIKRKDFIALIQAAQDQLPNDQYHYLMRVADNKQGKDLTARVYEIVCVNGLLILGESPLKHDGKSIECSLPISDGHGPLFGDIL
jgi:hypothetical protein